MSWRCLRFRAAFTPGGPVRAAARTHREGCAECTAYAALLERAAAPREPLPEALRGVLRAIPLRLRERRDAPWGVSEAETKVPPLRRPTGRLYVPDPAPLPEPLRRRLQAIARQAPAARPPLWIVQARYAVAASTLLITLAGAAFGNPLDHGRRWTRQVQDQVSGAVGEPLARRLEQAQDRGWQRLAAFREQRIAPWRESLADALAQAGEALAAAPSRAGALLDRILQPFDVHDPDPRGHHETDRTGPQGPAVRPLQENPNEP